MDELRFIAPARERPWLSLWESWHAEGVTERAFLYPLRPFGAPLPKGEASWVRYIAERYTIIYFYPREIPL